MTTWKNISTIFTKVRGNSRFIVYTVLFNRDGNGVPMKKPGSSDEPGENSKTEFCGKATDKKLLTSYNK